MDDLGGTPTIFGTPDIRSIGPDHKGPRLFRVRCRWRGLPPKDATGISVEVEGGEGIP